MSVKEQILSFLQQGGVHHGGALQRTEFKTRKGGLATGDNIKRRCNELVKEGKIHVDYEKGQAVFSADPVPSKKTTKIEIDYSGQFPVARHVELSAKEMVEIDWNTLTA